MIENTSKYTIVRNAFERVANEENDDLGIEVNFTGNFSSNRISCNSFFNKGYGINLLSYNYALTFAGNNFDSDFVDILRGPGLGGRSASAAEFQGSSSNPANNCFTPKPENSPIRHITSASPASTRPRFQYYFTKYEPGEPCLTDPDRMTRFDGYFENETPVLYNPCADTFNKPGKEFELKDLDTAYIHINNIHQQLSQNTQDSLLQAQLVSAKRHKNNVLSYLVSHTYSENNTAADQLLNNDTSLFSKKLLYSLSMSRENYSLANSLLNQFPQNTLDEQDFYDVQNINLQWHQSDSFQLSNQQSAILHTVANRDSSSSRSNARAILVVLENTYYDYISHRFDDDGDVENYAPQVSPHLDKISQPAIIPNPSKGNFALSIPSGFLQNGEILIYDFSGRQIHTQIVSMDNNAATFNFSDLRSGIYILQIRSEAEIKFTEKIMIIE